MLTMTSNLLHRYLGFYPFTSAIAFVSTDLPPTIYLPYLPQVDMQRGGMSSAVKFRTAKTRQVDVRRSKRGSAIRRPEKLQGSKVQGQLQTVRAEGRRSRYYVHSCTLIGLSAQEVWLGYWEAGDTNPAKIALIKNPFLARSDSEGDLQYPTSHRQGNTKLAS
ncbi:hypothetical protein F5Y15DRAFT_368356 [Xylariaceae sp. FL0016]|nr:hypothetical protein F5Y15DRAFT_368356 [Xylariaceae sp. FL0016]